MRIGFSNKQSNDYCVCVYFFFLTSLLCEIMHKIFFLLLLRAFQLFVSWSGKSNFQTYLAQISCEEEIGKAFIQFHSVRRRASDLRTISSIQWDCFYIQWDCFYSMGLLLYIKTYVFPFHVVTQCYGMQLCFKMILKIYACL